MELSEELKSYIEGNIPSPLNTPEKFAEAIIPKLQIHSALCTTSIGTVKKLLKPLTDQFGHRFFWRIDEDNKQKTAASIIEKICRSQDKPEPERYTFDNFDKKMTDLARFRVVCNFLSDAKKVAEVIRESGEVKDVFDFRKEESSVDLHPQERKSGERSIKFILEFKSQPGIFLEIQVMTQLQEVWDKKDHFLVYEQRRGAPERYEEKFQDYLDSKMFAMAELLYVADHYFDELRRTREE